MPTADIQASDSPCLLDQVCLPGPGPTRHAHPQEEGLLGDAFLFKTNEPHQIIND